MVRCLPRLLPGGKSLLYTAFLGGKAARVGLYDTATGKSRVLLEDANNAHYLRSGHLVFGRGNEIWAAAFDLARSEIVGSPQRMVEGVWAGGFFYATLFAASENGVLAYAPAGAQSGRRSLVWVDREGRETPLTREARAYAAPRLSPDGKSILVRIAEDTTDIWSYEIERGALTRLTSEGYEDGPLWTADGKAIIYPSNKSGAPALYRQPVAGKGEAVQLGQGGRTQYPETLSKDGKTIVVTEMNPKTGLDLFLIPLDADARPVPLLVTDSSEYAADLSPDGKWFVYISRASGRPEIGVRSVAGGGDESRVSLNGGTEPRWSRDGREIFFREGQKMMVAEVRTEPAVSDLEASSPVRGALRGDGRPDQLRRHPGRATLPDGEDGAIGGPHGAARRHRLGPRAPQGSPVRRRPTLIGQTLSHYRSPLRSAPAGWARSTAPPTPSSGARSRSSVLPEAFASDPERLARSSARRGCSPRSTTRASRTSTASRPRRSTDGTRLHLIAMELVEGEDLAERLKRGPIPIDEAIAIAKQVAEALEEAHDKGIVHRDLKPANVKLTPTARSKCSTSAWRRPGRVRAPRPRDLSQSPTLAHTGTAAGLILGTAAYMSPEQARGRAGRPARRRLGLRRGSLRDADRAQALRRRDGERHACRGAQDRPRLERAAGRHAPRRSESCCGAASSATRSSGCATSARRASPSATPPASPCQAPRQSRTSLRPGGHRPCGPRWLSSPPLPPS